MHSIFMLRCFNDCFAVLFFWLAVYCYQRNQWHLGSALYSTGLNVKMSLLLALPAVGVVLWLGAGRDRAIKQALLMGQVQVSLHQNLWMMRVRRDWNDVLMMIAGGTWL